jgi:hypothetical protein
MYEEPIVLTLTCGELEGELASFLELCIIVNCASAYAVCKGTTAFCAGSASY